jgi:hypothetical protein
MSDIDANDINEYIIKLRLKEEYKYSHIFTNNIIEQ